MSFFWSDGGRGRLVGTNVEASPFRPPAAFPLGRAPDGTLVGWDPIGEHTVRLSVSYDGNLELRGPDGGRVAAERRGALGWLPPFRP